MTSILKATSTLLALIAALPAAAKADGVADCERYAMAFFKRHAWNVTRVQIERGASLLENRYDDNVGSQRVSTEYMGFARLTRPDGTRRQRFVCLHAGDGKRPVYFGVFDD